MQLIDKIFAASDERAQGYVVASYANLDRKRQAGTYCPIRALALLRNNAADMAKAYCRALGWYDRNAFKSDTLDAIAAKLLAQWSNRHGTN